MCDFDLISLLHWAGIISGLIAAVIWIVASKATVTESDDRYYVGTDMRGTYKGKPIWVVSTAMKQSRFNAIAAVFTLLFVILQAVAELLTKS